MIIGVGHFGSFFVIFEYFRVQLIWVSLTGALNREDRLGGRFEYFYSFLLGEGKGESEAPGRGGGRFFY